MYAFIQGSIPQSTVFSRQVVVCSHSVISVNSDWNGPQTHIVSTKALFAAAIKLRANHSSGGWLRLISDPLISLYSALRTSNWLDIQTEFHTFVLMPLVRKHLICKVKVIF